MLPMEGIAVKKIALTIAAVATLGLAACNNAATETNEANVAATDLEATSNEAMMDVDAAANEASALNAANAELDNAGQAVENASEAVENAAEEVATNGM